MLRSCVSLLSRGAPAATGSVMRAGSAMTAGSAMAAGSAVRAGPLRVPVRRWNQCTHCISLPPRYPVSLQETLCHCAFMYMVWLVPTFVLMSQVKIWKRRYLQTA